MNYFFERFFEACELLKRNKVGVALWVIQLYIRNSVSWFNFKNTIKLFSYCFNRIWSGAKIIVVTTRSVARLTFLIVNSIRKPSPDKALFMLIIIFFMLQLKLHQAGVIKLKDEKVIGILALMIVLGVCALLSKMDLTKLKPIEIGNKENEDVDNFIKNH